MRYSVLLACLPGLAWAEDFTLPVPATDAVVYLQGATVTRAAETDLPAGDHRLLVPVLPGAQGRPRVRVAGATLGTVETVPDGLVDGRSLFTPAQTAADDRLRDTEEAAHLAEDDRLRAAAAVTAAEDALAFLRSVSGAALDGLDPEAIGRTATTVAGGIAGAEADRAAARADLRAADRAVEEAQRVLAQARRDLDATGANFGPVTLLAIGVTLDAPGPVALTLEDFTGQAGWSPLYDLTLDAAEEVVRIDRKIAVRQSTGAPWSDLALRLSTADPFAAVAPRTVTPNLASTGTRDRSLSRSVQPEMMADGAAALDRAAAPEPVRATADTDGPVVAYDYPDPVRLPGTGGEVVLDLDRITPEVRIFNRAAPRTDTTAFLMAELTNSTAEPLLSGPATLYRDAEKVGDAVLPPVPAGDEAEIAFGPQHHLQLDFALLDNETGDRGIFVTSGTRRQDMVFRLRNLSDAPETVETRFALPDSEEEALEIDLTLSPAPDETDVEDRRGVAQWNLDVAPGAEVAVEIGVDIEWPEGRVLYWQP